MKPIYKNDYGTTYSLKNGPDLVRDMLLVVDTIGIFMSRTDMEHLLGLVRKSHGRCCCPECGDDRSGKMWCKTPFVDICLKLDEATLGLLEDLLNGTLFSLSMYSTLKSHRLTVGT